MRRKVKLFVEESWLLILAAIMFGGLLAFTNAAWAPRIAANEIAKFNALAGSLLEGAADFEPLGEPVVITAPGGKTIPVPVNRALNDSGQTVGWAFVVVGSGFADKIRLVVGVDDRFETLAGFGVLSSNETPGFGDKITIPGGFFQSQFPGAPADALELVKIGSPDEIDSQIVAISGATVTSQAVVDALNLYLVGLKNAMQEQGLLQ